MTELNKNFWVFHTSYWVFVGIILFIYGLTYGHWEIALIRNIYTPSIGFGLSLLMIHFYKGKSSNHFLYILLLSFAGALISSLVVNPITYALLGYDLQNLSLAEILQDLLYFALFYTVWSLLYLQRSGASPKREGTAETIKMDLISVSKERRKLKLDPNDIAYIQANGDYVEFFTENDNYLKQGTIQFYETELSSGPFVQIHRSIIINTNKIQAISGPTKGQFWIKLGNNHEVRSSRKYQNIIETLLPKAL